MRNILLFIAVCGLFASSCKKNKVDDEGVQAAYEAGFHTFPGSLAFADQTAIATSDNNIVICGINGSQALLVKLTSKGTIIWQRMFFLDQGAEVTAIAELQTGGYAVVGGDSKSSFVITTNATGQKVWKNYYGGSTITIARTLTISSDGHIILAGSAYKDSLRSAATVYLAKIKPDGKLQWERNYETAVASCYSVTETASGELFLTGSPLQNGYAQGVYLLKTSASGNKLWERTPSATEEAIGISSKISNGYIITLSATRAGNYQAAAVFKFDSEGKKLWEQEIAEAGSNLQASAMHVFHDGSLIVTGAVQNNMSIDSTDILLARLDASGNKLWTKKIGGTNEDRAYNIIAEDAGLVLVGSTKSYGIKKGEPNIFLLRTNDAGDVIY